MQTNFDENFSHHNFFDAANIFNFKYCRQLANKIKKLQFFHPSVRAAIGFIIR